jgi:predicted metalloprotease with PDZ domain
LFEKYVYRTSVHPPSDELARAGWRFVYSEKPNAFITANEADDHGITGWYSYGADLNAKGVVRDVRDGSAAWRAGLAPGLHILAVNNQEFSSDVLEYALKKAQHSSAPISLITSQTGWFQTLSLDYHDGIRYPHLERIEGTPDMLAAIMVPHAK